MFYQTMNPATGALVESFAPISDHELDGVLATAHNTFETDWRKRTVADRARIVSKAASILREKAEEMEQRRLFCRRRSRRNRLNAFHSTG
jgi:succinate-semialdehyde dehydrogenase/glutarate-semialdehyde dehydrogenase